MNLRSEFPGYIKNAIISFNEIMSSKRKNAMENLNRANKGELFVLHYLASRHDQVLPTELGAALQSSTQRISALLRVLEKKGHVERNIDQNNRRNVLVTITQVGRQHVTNEMAKMQRCMAQVFTEMGETDTGEFIRLLKRFSELTQEFSGPGCRKDG